MPLEVIDNNFSSIIETFGQKLKYYSGRLCSCVAENNGLPKIDCGCNLGFWYDEPEDIIGVRTSVDYKYLNTPQGMIYNGGAKLTIPKYVEVEENGKWLTKEQIAYKKLAHGDVIVVDNKVRRDTDVLRKGVRDKLFAFDIQEIISISQANKIFIPTIDFVLNGTTIQWIGDQPSEGSYYTVEFNCKQQYKVWEVGAKDRGTQDDEMPKVALCVLRRYIEQDTQNPIDHYDYEQKIF